MYPKLWDKERVKAIANIGLAAVISVDVWPCYGQYVAMNGE